MLNLTNIFELIVHRFDDGTLAQEDFVHQAHELVSHVLAASSNQFQALLLELFKQGLRDIPLISEELTGKMLGHFGHRFAIIRIPGSQSGSQEFSSVIDNQV